MVRMHRKLAGLFMMGCIALSGCGDGGSETGPSAGGGTPTKPAVSPPMPTPTPTPPSPTPVQPATVETRSPEELVTAGRSVYTANCIACHNMNPAQDGALGPAVAGSSMELLQARVIRGDYPEGYEPKRPSKIMIPLPHLQPKLPELAAYLASAK